MIDESGLLMAPLVRRTWAPRGQTPKLVQRCGKREKVSVAAAVWLSPLRDRLGLFARTLVDDYFDNWYSAAFLEALLQEVPGRVVVIWDGGNMHKGDPIDQLQDLMADREGLEHLRQQATEHLEKAKTRLQVIEATANRKLNEGETELMMQRLGSAQDQLPLVLEMAQFEQEALAEIAGHKESQEPQLP